MTTKGYPTVANVSEPTPGSIGEVGGLSTSDTALLKETFPNSPFWRTGDKEYLPENLKEDFNAMVLRGGVVGGYLFPEGFNRNYTGDFQDVPVYPENTPGGEFVQAWSPPPGPHAPDISFGSIPVWWKPGDPANAFTPNPSSSPMGNPLMQFPPPAAFVSHDWSWKSRPPFVGPGTDLTPLQSSQQMSKHTVDSYLLGSSKVEGE
jgi:hypothetical protein